MKKKIMWCDEKNLWWWWWQQKIFTSSHNFFMWWKLFFALDGVHTTAADAATAKMCCHPPPPGGWAWGVPPGGDSPGGGAGPLCPLRARGGCVGTGGPPRGGQNTPFFSEKPPPFEVQKFAFNFEMSQKSVFFQVVQKIEILHFLTPPPQKCALFWNFALFCTFLQKSHFFTFLHFFHFLGGSPPAMHTFNLLHFATLSNIINYCHYFFLTSSSKPLLSPNFHNFILWSQDNFILCRDAPWSI